MMVLVTGATGAVGPLVVKAFHDAGHRIRTLSIDPSPTDIWPDDVEARIGDITDISIVQSAMHGIDVVIHLAALLHIPNPSPVFHEKYERINVGGTSNVVGAAKRSGVKRIVFFSTIAVYGRSHGQIVTEDTPPHPDTFYAGSKLNAERIVLDAKDKNDEKIGTVLRLGAIYGSRIKGNYQRLVQSLAKGHLMPIGNGSNRRTLVYDKDVARAAVLASEHPNAAGKIFNVSDGGFHTVNDIVGAVCGALGRKPPYFSLPVTPMRFVAGILEDGARLCGRCSPITRATIDKYTEDIAADSARIQKELRFISQYDLDAGWRETIQGMRERGIL